MFTAQCNKHFILLISSFRLERMVQQFQQEKREKEYFNNNNAVSNYSVENIIRQTFNMLMLNYRSEHEEALKEKNQVIEELRKALEDLKGMWNHQKERLSSKDCVDFTSLYTDYPSCC